MSMQPSSLSVGTPSKPHPKKNLISIRWSLPLFVMAPVVVGIVLTSWLAFRSGKQAIEDSIDKISEEVATNIEKEVTSYLNKPILLSESILVEVNSGILDTQDMRALSRHFWRFTQSKLLTNNLYYGNQAGEIAYSKRHDTHTQIGLLDQETNFQYATYQPDAKGNLGEKISVSDYDPRTRPWYKEASQSKQPVWADVYIAYSDASLVLTRATPVVNASGQVEGVFGIDIFLSELGTFLKSLTVSPNGRAFILQENGDLIATSTDDRLFTGDGENQTRIMAANSQDPLIKATADQLSQAMPDLSTITDYKQFQFKLDGQRQLSRVYTLKDLGVDWFVAVTIPQDDYLALIRANARNTVFMGAGITAIASLLALGAALYIIQPIDTLNQAAEEIKRNQFDPHTLATVVNRPDEFSTLAEIFEDMATVVMSREQSLAEQVKHLETQNSSNGSNYRGGGDRYSLDLAIAYAQHARQQYENR